MIDILQVAGALEAGGLEQMVVNIANLLPRNRFRSHVCTTRGDGPLVMSLAQDVHYTCLRRVSRVDVSAALRLGQYAREHQVAVVHAHGTSVFFVALASLLSQFPPVVWHDHFGRYSFQPRATSLYGAATHRTRGVITANAALADWAKTSLLVRGDRVWYLPNFVTLPNETLLPVELPGTPGFRIVCVANLRPQKDHETLLRAMQKVLVRVPQAHLILLGSIGDHDYHRKMVGQMTLAPLKGHVSWMGSRRDVAAILSACDIGVLSSKSEGLPLALLEYGRAGLATVTTNSGQCSEVVEGGKCGILTPIGDADALATGLLTLLESPPTRKDLGETLRRRIETAYSEAAVMGRLIDIYDTVLANA